MKTSIIIPAYNEEKRIENTLKEYCNFFKNLKDKGSLDFEIIIVINNTTDRTEEIVKKYMKKCKELRCLNFKQQGKGFAITEGFKDALKRKNDLIGFVDADMSSKPEAFYELIKNINGYDGIIASREIKGAEIKKTLKRTIISFTFNFIVKSLFFLPYEDTQCGCKLFKREVIKEIAEELTETRWIFDIDLLYKLKKKRFRVKEFPTIWEDKSGSKITNMARTSLQMFWELIKLRLKKLKHNI